MTLATVETAPPDDVLIVGYGPVGKTLALMLARRGHRVTAIERKAEPYPFPRAVCMDHEVRRIMNGLGFAGSLDKIAIPSPRYQWLNENGELLIDIDWTVDSVSGGPEAYFFHQPSLEALLDEQVRHEPGVTVKLGWELQAMSQDETGATLTICRSDDDSQSETLRGRYLVGADGANSQVRQRAGLQWLDLGFQADWLVVDVLPNQGTVLRVPEAGQFCSPKRPTTFVPGGVENGRLHRRWEFMRLPGETTEQLQDPAYVWSLLRPWIDESEASLVRFALYTFRSRVAENWRSGRVLLAGDAAHVMPPFMGQGLCSGVRDAWSLVWRLDRVLRGVGTPDLLDSYGQERRPHVTSVINLSVQLGRIICVSDEAEAAARDRALLDGTAPPLPPFPSLLDGLLARDGGAVRMAGTLGIHGEVERAGQRGTLDEILGQGLSILTWKRPASDALSLAQIARLDRAGAIRAVLVPTDATFAAQAGHLVDVTGRFQRYFEENGIEAVVVRPDFYVFGAVSSLDGLGPLVDELLDRVEVPDGKPAATAPRNHVAA